MKQPKKLIEVAMPVKEISAESLIRYCYNGDSNKGKIYRSKALTENSQEYKIVKESAKQLGLDLTEE